MFKFLNNRSFGNQFEEFAASKIESTGCQIIEKNFNCKLGEIDLILKDNGILVFVEVHVRFFRFLFLLRIG